MTVKDKVGRQRYVAFRVRSRQPLSRAEIGEAIRRAVAPPEAARPTLILWRDGLGLVKCAHTAKEATIALLRSLDTAAGAPITVETLGTSGTIRRARAKYLEPKGGPEPGERVLKGKPLP